MKLASFLALASLAVSAAFAQTIEIGYPQPNQQITPGQNLTVQVLRPDSIQGSTEVAIVISMLECPQNGACPAPADVLGNVLYVGPYNPQFPPPPTTQHTPQQNFTVTVPSYFSANNTAQLAVTHLTLIGAGPSPLLEFRNLTLQVV